MSRSALIFAAAAVAVMASQANANDVLSSSLPVVNGPVGSDGAAATTTTDANGRSTTVTGPSGDSNRLYLSPVTGAWQPSAVGDGGTVGITNTYTNDGDGAAYLATTNYNSKGDFEYLLNRPVALSDLTSISYDWYVDSSSTSPAADAPALRLEMLKDGNYAGYLVYEPDYNGGAPTRGAWQTSSLDLTSGVWWATNSALGPTGAVIADMKDLQGWLDANDATPLTVFGINFGVGSGWSGTFAGAVDNVSVDFTGGPSIASNFKVAAAVPEPASWALMIGGFICAGAAMRRRSRRAQTA